MESSAATKMVGQKPCGRRPAKMEIALIFAKHAIKYNCAQKNYPTTNGCLPSSPSPRAQRYPSSQSFAVACSAPQCSANSTRNVNPRKHSTKAIQRTLIAKFVTTTTTTRSNPSPSTFHRAPPALQAATLTTHGCAACAITRIRFETSSSFRSRRSCASHGALPSPTRVTTACARSAT